MQMNLQIWPQCTSVFDVKALSMTHSSVADDRPLSFLQLENVAAVGSVGVQEVKFQAFVSFLEQSHIHPLKEKERTGRQLANRGSCDLSDEVMQLR